MDKAQWDEAVGECKKAIELDPKYALGYRMLGYALWAKTQWDEAIGEFEKAIELDPKLDWVHVDLGHALWSKNKLDEAIGEYRKAIEVNPKLAQFHQYLGHALLAKNQFEEAVGEYRKAIELEPKLVSAQPVANAERLARLEAKLADVLEGKAMATDNGERLDLAELCRLTHRYVAAVRLYADAFTADPKLAEDLKAGHRFNAAWSATIASSGPGDRRRQARRPGARRLREQALAWLRADLEQWKKRVESGTLEDRQAHAGHARALAARSQPGLCA